MFDETLASRVARLEEAEQSARDRIAEANGAATPGVLAIAKDDYSVRKLALLKVEQALLIAGF